MALDLIQDKQYMLELVRLFRDQELHQVLESRVTTVMPVHIGSTSITDGSLVFDRPKEFTLTADRPLASAKVTLRNNDDLELIKHKIRIEGANVVVVFEEDLPRQKNYTLTLDEVAAHDKGGLHKPFAVTFKTSGGPKVVGVNIGRRSVDPGVTIKLSLDQPLQPGQSLEAKMKLTVGGVAVPFTSSVAGQMVVVSPRAPLDFCRPFTVAISEGLISQYDVVSDAGWSINSWTRCHTVVSIGNSVQGRPIYAWKFGTGATKMLFVGNTHGDEVSTKSLLDQWISELEVNPSRLPAGKTLIIIPTLNPDGLAAGSRFNARGVDLNRNFPANDWKSDVTMPRGIGMVPGGGGASSLSEPESAALAGFIGAERPSVVLTYHSVASVVSGNDSGQANALAESYARISRYRYLPKSQVNTVFQYDTTGSFEDWLHDKLGIAALLIELGSHSNSEFHRNKDALWDITAR